MPGLSAFIAQNYAAGQKTRVWQAWKTTLWMTGVFGTLCSLLFIFYGSEVFSIFVSYERKIFQMGIPIGYNVIENDEPEEFFKGRHCGSHKFSDQ